MAGAQRRAASGGHLPSSWGGRPRWPAHTHRGRDSRSMRRCASVRGSCRGRSGLLAQLARRPRGAHALGAKNSQAIYSGGNPAVPLQPTGCDSAAAFCRLLVRFPQSCATWRRRLVTLRSLVTTSRNLASPWRAAAILMAVMLGERAAVSPAPRRQLRRRTSPWHVGCASGGVRAFLGARPVAEFVRCCGRGVRTMRDPDLVRRAERAAAALERAWGHWRTMHGLGTAPVPPVSSYVGYSLVEPWGQPRVIFGLQADEAERLAALLDGHDCVGPVHAEVTARPEWRHPALADSPAWPADDPLGIRSRPPRLTHPYRQAPAAQFQLPRFNQAPTPVPLNEPDQAAELAALRTEDVRDAAADSSPAGESTPREADAVGIAVPGSDASVVGDPAVDDATGSDTASGDTAVADTAVADTAVSDAAQGGRAQPGIVSFRPRSQQPAGRQPGNSPGSAARRGAVPVVPKPAAPPPGEATPRKTPPQSPGYRGPRYEGVPPQYQSSGQANPVRAPRAKPPARPDTAPGETSPSQAKPGPALSDPTRPGQAKSGPAPGGPTPPGEAQPGRGQPGQPQSDHTTERLAQARRTRARRSPQSARDASDWAPDEEPEHRATDTAV
jgi:hypothetical protein